MNRLRPVFAILLFVSLAACSSATPTPAPMESLASATPEPTDVPTVTMAPTEIPPTPSPTIIPSPTVDPHFSPEVQDFAVRLVEDGKVPGIAIGLLTPEGSFFFNYGTSTWDSDQPIDEHTLFEIGSITKVFTALLLANAVEAGMLTLDTPAQDLLPEDVSMPMYKDQPLTLQDIATHRTNLPRMPSNFSPKQTFNPYADYTADLMYEYVSSFKNIRPFGTNYEYSNLGYMLLGDLMEKAYGKPYEELLIEIITDPLGMPDTRITLSEERAARFAQGHSGAYPVSSWDFVLPGVGAIRSTTSDMLRFLAANLEPDGQLGDAMRLIREDCFQTGNTFIEVCLGIHTYHRFEKMIYQHDGQTGGYFSFSSFVPEDGTAVIVLVNSNYNISALGLHLLDPKVPLLRSN